MITMFALNGVVCYENLVRNYWFTLCHNKFYQKKIVPVVFLEHGLIIFFFMGYFVRG